MKIDNPKVMLDDEARNGVKEEVRSGFLDWLFEFNVTGDDGEVYMLGGSILSMELEKNGSGYHDTGKGKRQGSAASKLHLQIGGISWECHEQNVQEWQGHVGN